MNEQDSDTLVVWGGEVKALEGTGKVGGYLVRFSTPQDPDLTGDFFDASTDFGPHTRTLVFYDHGFDDTLACRTLSTDAAMETREAGVWVEAQLALRDEYERRIYEMAKAGKLGWSSGTASHLVEREPMGKAYRITRWPLGLDASLTPTPAEPRAQAVPLKSLFTAGPRDGLTLDTHSELALAAAEEFVARVRSLADLRAQDGRTLSEARREQVKRLYDAAAEVLALTEPKAPPSARASVVQTYLQHQAAYHALFGGNHS